MNKFLVLIACVGLMLGVAVLKLGKGAIPRYDELVRLRENTQREWAQIDVLLHRRYELIPRLVDAVKGYDQHETSTLVAAADAWTGYGRARSLDDKLAASYRVEQNLRSFTAFGQLNPDLKANGLFLELMHALNDTEDQIARQRMSYNSAVSALNTEVNSFYGRFVAWAGGIHAAPYYEPPAYVRQSPNAGFTPQAVASAFHAGDLILKGTLQSGNTRRAVLETPAGEELVVSAGSQIDGAPVQVKAIGEHDVTLLETVVAHDGTSTTREIQLRQ